MGECDSERDRIFTFVPAEFVAGGCFSAFEASEVLAECHEVEGISDEDADDGFPTEVHEHVAHSEVPFFCDHEDWWSSEVGECATNGDVNEE